MLLERVLRAVFRNYSTLFLAAALVTVPLHVAHEYFFRDVVAVGDIHDFVAEFPEERKVRGVGPDELNRYRAFGAGVVALELALLPLLARVARRVLIADSAGEVPGALAAWSRAFRGTPSAGPARRGWAGTLVVCAVLALGVIALVQAAGSLLAQPFPDDVSWAAFGVVRGLARAAGAPFVLVAAVSIRDLPPERGRSLPRVEFPEVSS